MLDWTTIWGKKDILVADLIDIVPRQHAPMQILFCGRSRHNGNDRVQGLGRRSVLWADSLGHQWDNLKNEKTPFNSQDVLSLDYTLSSILALIWGFGANSSTADQFPPPLSKHTVSSEIKEPYRNKQKKNIMSTGRVLTGIFRPVLISARRKRIWGIIGLKKNICSA